MIQSAVFGLEGAELALGDAAKIRQQQLFNNSRIRQASHAAVITTKQKRTALTAALSPQKGAAGLQASFVLETGKKSTLLSSIKHSEASS